MVCQNWSDDSIVIRGGCQRTCGARSRLKEQESDTNKFVPKYPLSRRLSVLQSNIKRENANQSSSSDYTNYIKPTNSYGPPGLQQSGLEAGEPPGEWAERRPGASPSPRVWCRRRLFCGSVMHLWSKYSNVCLKWNMEKINEKNQV